MIKFALILKERIDSLQDRTILTQASEDIVHFHGAILFFTAFFAGIFIALNMPITAVLFIVASRLAKNSLDTFFYKIQKRYISQF